MDQLYLIAATFVDWPLYNELAKEFTDYEPLRDIDSSPIDARKEMAAYLATLTFSSASIGISDRNNPGIDHYMVSLAGKLSEEEFKQITKYTTIKILKQRDLAILTGTIRQWLEVITSGCKKNSPYLEIANKVFEAIKQVIPDMFLSTVKVLNPDGSFYLRD